jgi:transcription elongation GreA/GreB family factor
MNSSFVLSGGDMDRLKSLLRHEGPGPWLDPEHSEILEAILDASVITDDVSALAERVGLDDETTLVSTTDSRDLFSLRIVTPHEADIDMDKIPVSMPIALAVLGHRVGETVSWVTPRGIREMRILAVRKCRQPALAC